jgi:hypothetical protein
VLFAKQASGEACGCSQELYHTHSEYQVKQLRIESRFMRTWCSDKRASGQERTVAFLAAAKVIIIAEPSSKKS